MLSLIVALCAAQTPVVPYSDIGSKPVAPEEVPPVQDAVPAAPPPPPVVRKLDCLAGVCLGSSPSSTAPTLVTVSDHKWSRTVEVCGNRVVGVWINHSWYQTGFTFTGALAGSTTPVYTQDGTSALTVRERVEDAMEAKGWFLSDVRDTLSIYSHSEVNGGRGVVFERSGEDVNGWTVGVITLHPDRPALCAGRDGAGL